MAIHPETIRALMNSEHRTHAQVDSVIEVLLADAERTAAAQQRVLAADEAGRAPADRIAVLERGGDAVTDSQRALATVLLVDMLTAAALRGVTLEHLDGVTDLPGACLDAVLRRS